MIKKISYLLIYSLLFSCITESKETQKGSSFKDSEWLTLKNKDSVKILGFSERRINAEQIPIVFVHYQSDRFTGDPNNQTFKNETLLIAAALKNKSQIPDTLVLQAMGKKKETLFTENQMNFNTVVIFKNGKWKFNKD